MFLPFTFAANLCLVCVTMLLQTNWLNFWANVQFFSVEVFF